MRWDLEEIARLGIERANVDCPVNPDLLAHGLELIVRDGGSGCVGYLIGDRIFVDDTLRPERRAFAIAHEIGHHLLRQAGLEHPSRPDEPAANYLAAALLLPKLEIERDMRRGWDLLMWRARHRWASYEALARRLTALREARACIFDWPLHGQRRPTSYVLPTHDRPTEEEREAAHEARACGAPVELRAGLTAWPVLEHHWHRVITVAA